MSPNIDFMQFNAIDMHAHLGTYTGYAPAQARFLNAEADEVVQRARDCNIVKTVASDLGAFDPAPDRPVDVDAANERTRGDAEQHDGLWFYTVVNPKLPGWEDHADRMLKHPKCVGVKLHPRWNFWSVEEHGDRLFAFLSERNLLTLTHTGNAGNEPDRFIPFANKYPGVRLILAHIGHSETDVFDLQVEAVKKSTEGNVWADTSSSRSMLARVIEHAVDQLGAERILFGTDTPLYFAATQKSRIAYASISDEAKRMILYENAAQLLA
jgi:predicted TIM-barrel fold metal-dependent hydrolase